MSVLEILPNVRKLNARCAEFWWTGSERVYTLTLPNHVVNDRDHTLRILKRNGVQFISPSTGPGIYTTASLDKIIRHIFAYELDQIPSSQKVQLVEEGCSNYWLIADGRIWNDVLFEWIAVDSVQLQMRRDDGTRYTADEAALCRKYFGTVAPSRLHPTIRLTPADYSVVERGPTFCIIAFPNTPATFKVTTSGLITNLMTGTSYSCEHDIVGLTVAPRVQMHIYVPTLVRKLFNTFDVIPETDKCELTRCGYPGYWITRDRRVWCQQDWAWIKTSNSRVLFCMEDGTQRERSIHYLLDAAFGFIYVDGIEVPSISSVPSVRKCSMGRLGYPDYQLTDDGRMWSNRVYQWVKPRTLPGSHTPSLTIHRIGGTLTKTAAWFVATMFIPNPRNCKYVDFINENPLDIRVANLQWRLEHHACR